ncbi:MAG: hypothetical protein K1W05_04975 [Desulfovibrio sp.]
MSNPESRDNQMFVLVAAVFIAVMVVPAVYAMYAGKINGPLLELAKKELWIFSGLDEPGLAFEKLSRVDPADLDWATMDKILTYAGSWMRWPLLVVLGVLVAISCWLGSVEKLKRKLNMEKLLAENSKNFPCLMPIVGKGKYLLSPESYDNGPWRIARTPIQFVIAHGLVDGPNGFPCKAEDVLENGMPFLDSPALGQCVFKKEAAARVLQKQLGEPFADLACLSPVRKALAAAFILYALGKKHECIAILDDVSASYSENGGVPQCPLLENGDFSAALDEVLLAWASFSSRKAVARHLSYQLPLFMALLGEARKKGVLATSQFIWLRPLDRPLWYALNQCGGRAAWTEALAAWAHFQAEEHAGKTLSAPHIDAAVESLKNSLESQGWLKRDYDPFYQNITIQKENSESVVFAPAEEETEQ